MMNRRGFLKRMGLAVGVVVLAKPLAAAVRVLPEGKAKTWLGESSDSINRYFAAAAPRFQAAIYRELFKTNPYAELFKKDTWSG